MKQVMNPATTLVFAEEIAEGDCFRKKTGTYFYLRISGGAVKYYIEKGVEKIKAEEMRQSVKEQVDLLVEDQVPESYRIDFGEDMIPHKRFAYWIAFKSAHRTYRVYYTERKDTEKPLRILLQLVWIEKQQAEIAKREYLASGLKKIIGELPIEGLQATQAFFTLVTKSTPECVDQWLSIVKKLAGRPEQEGEAPICVSETDRRTP